MSRASARSSQTGPSLDHRELVRTPCLAIGQPCPAPADVKLADSWGDSTWTCLSHAEEIMLNARGAFIASEDSLTKAEASAPPPPDVPESGLDEQPDRVIAAAAVSASAAPNRSLIQSRFLVVSTRAVRGTLVESHIKRSATAPADTSADPCRVESGLLIGILGCAPRWDQLILSMICLAMSSAC